MATGHDAFVDGYPVGTWLANRRREARLAVGSQGALSDARKAALADVDPFWCPAWPLVWQRRCILLKRYLAAGGPVETEPGHMIAGEDVVAWLAHQLSHWDTFHEEQRRLLAELGVTLSGGGIQSAPRLTQDHKFMRNLAVAAAYAQREGHLNVPRQHIEITDGAEIKLGIWISNQRSRRARLHPQRIEALDQLGMRWN
ncbi:MULTISPECIES: helicase associated domain-containing protein [unclassified Streptomyces]|uniref:helicase associated domain-containing protein n=1 Tax=unclassified Streptomyces TaxID=2593676 RepID=UPI001FAB50E2|nr:helicase associated domain-containing protein [Streptomyces sp. PBSH9]